MHILRESSLYIHVMAKSDKHSYFECKYKGNSQITDTLWPFG